MRRQSRKRVREAPSRRRALEVVRLRDGDGCYAFKLLCDVPLDRIRNEGAPLTCWGDLDGHEVIQRSVRPGGHLEPDNIRLVCRRHHEWLERDAMLAHELGLLKFSWERPS